MTVLFVVGTVLLSAPAGVAKQKKPATKTVSGVVFDDAQNLIAGATVELTDVQTGKVLDIYSQEDGHYQFTDLLFSHDYKIRAMYNGASSEVRQVSSMDMRPRPVLDLVIPKPKKP
jgi:ABC-type transporter Mla subunit MlaD